MTMEKKCSVSIDIDSLRHYHRIHGLATPRFKGPDPVYTIALPRFLELFRLYNIKATFFVIGEDLQEPIHQEILHQALAEGHELANHTFHHEYHLTRFSEYNMEKEIAEGEEALKALLPPNRRIVGFRAPGYNIDEKLLKILKRRGYLYDSSIFPSYPYYIAKGLVMAFLALKGTPSASLLGSPKVLLQPVKPFIPSFEGDNEESSPSPFHLEDIVEESVLWELPMTLIPYLRLPYIGTSLLLYPRLLLSPMTQFIMREYDFINLELHAIDMLDPQRDPHLNPLRDKQPDLAIPLAEKFERFHEVFSQLAAFYRFITLEEMALSL